MKAKPNTNCGAPSTWWKLGAFKSSHSSNRQACQTSLSVLFFLSKPALAFQKPQGARMPWHPDHIDWHSVGGQPKLPLQVTSIESIPCAFVFDSHSFVAHLLLFCSPRWLLRGAQLFTHDYQFLTCVVDCLACIFRMFQCPTSPRGESSVSRRPQ